MRDIRYLDLDDALLEYGQLPALGATTGPTLVLLHEGLGCVELWKDFPQALCATTGCGVLAYSRQGYGRSSPIELPRRVDYLSEAGPAELGRVLDALGLEQVVLVGHSDGGSIALAYAARNDPRVLGVVTLAAHVSVEAEALAGVQRTTAAYRNGSLAGRLVDYHGANLDGAFHGWSDTWLNPAFLHWTLEPELPRIRIPVLAIQGCEDEYATPDQLAIIRRQVPARCRTELLAGCRHFPQDQAREPTLALIADFLDSLHQVG